MDLFYILSAVVFYLLSGCLSCNLNRDDLASKIYLMGGLVSLAIGVYFLLNLLKANGF